MRYLITGANRGLGLEFVRQLLQKKEVEIIATARSLESAQELNEFKAHSEGRLSLYPLDIDSEDSVNSLKSELQDLPIDVLINNAGRLTPSKSIEQLHLPDVLNEFNTNTVGTLRVCKALVSNVISSQRRIIVNISSKMGSIADNSSGGAYSYRISKTALNMATRCLAIDLKWKDGIAVAMHPGWALTRMGGPNALIETEESVAGMLNVIDGLTLEHSGQFIEYTGEILPW